MDVKLFSVLPMTQRFSLEAGHVYKGSITIAIPNDATEDFAYIVQVTPFSVYGNNYEADLTTSTARTEIANWITLENEKGTVPPNGTTKVNFTITVPESAAPGGQYASLLVSSDPSATKTAANNDATSVNNVFQLASVIYADVKGEVVRSGTILENNLPSFSFNNKLVTTTVIENKGNTHQDAVIAISVENAITGDQIFPADKNSDEFFSEIIMPETTRLITEEIPDLPLIGLVKIKQTVYFNDIPSVSETEMLICPLWFIILVILTITAFISGLIFRIKYHKKKRALML